MSACALNSKPNAEGSCIAPDLLVLVTNYTTANTFTELKKETNCNDDKCILDKVNIPIEIEEKIKREALKAPTTSYDHNYWLNNTEIDTVISQMRVKFPGFAHGFIHMIDLKSFNPVNVKSFDYKVLPVTETDFANAFKCGIEKSSNSCLNTHNDAPLHSYGIVCNTDSSKGSGQHWFAIFISTDQKDPENTSKPWIRIECFNSAGGGSTNEEFNTFWTETAMKIAQATSLKCTFDPLGVSTIQHQSPDTGNCGSYSLFYIYSRLMGVHPSEFNNPKKPVSDFAMQRFRKVCFSIDEDKSHLHLF